MNAKERLLDFIKEQGITPSEFERKCGLSNGYIKKLKASIGSDKIEDMIRVYPQLDSEWLITGNKKRIQPIDDITITYGNGYETFLLPQSAMGGSLSGFAAEGATLQNCEKVISPIKGIDFAISVYGDSMAPEYPSGSRVLIKKINPNVFIDWGKVYVLDTCNGVIIKEVLKSEKEGCVVCHSINPDAKYSDFEISLSDIYGIYRVLMCLSAK